MSRARSGQLPEALAELTELTKTDPTDPNHWYNAACVYAMLSARDADKKEEYARRSIEKIQEAVKAGYKDIQQMTNEEAFNPLRDRDDFKRLVADLEASLTPKNRRPAPIPAKK
jgi:hypothetical protein